MVSDTEPIIPDDELDRLWALGRAIYNEQRKHILEPQYNGQDVAIHLDTGDYEVGSPTSRPAIALHKRHPEGGMIMVTDVGPPRPHEMLAVRVFAARYISEHRKRSQEHGSREPCYS